MGGVSIMITFETESSMQYFNNKGDRWILYPDRIECITVNHHYHRGLFDWKRSMRPETHNIKLFFSAIEEDLIRIYGKMYGKSDMYDYLEHKLKLGYDFYKFYHRGELITHHEFHSKDSMRLFSNEIQKCDALSHIIDCLSIIRHGIYSMKGSLIGKTFKGDMKTDIEITEDGIIFTTGECNYVFIDGIDNYLEDRGIEDNLSKVLVTPDMMIPLLKFSNVEKESYYMFKSLIEKYSVRHVHHIHYPDNSTKLINLHDFNEYFHLDGRKYTIEELAKLFAEEFTERG